MMNTLNIDMDRVGRELNRARNRRDLTQAEAAEIIGVARTTLIAIEQGKRYCSQPPGSGTVLASFQKAFT